MQQLKHWVESTGWVLAWACLGLLARFVLTLVVGGELRFYDERDYHDIAVNLLSGSGYATEFGPTAFRAPAQAVWIAAIYAVVGQRALFVHLAQSLLLFPLPFAVARLGRLAGATVVVSNLAAAFAAVHPAITYASTTLYPVALTASALVIGVWLVAEALHRDRTSWGAAGGATLGVAALATPYFAPLPLLVGLIAASRRQARVGLTTALVGTLLVGAWISRNSLVLGSPTLSTNGGFNLALGANDRATPRSGNWIEPDQPVGGLPNGEVARDQAYRGVAMAWIAKHPLRYARLATGRALATLDSVGKPRTAGVHQSWWAQVVGWALLPWVLAGLAGLLIDWRKPEARIVGTALLLVMLASAATISKPRFRFPVDPLLGVFALLALQHLLSAWQDWRRRHRTDDEAREPQPCASRRPL